LSGCRIFQGYEKTFQANHQACFLWDRHCARALGYILFGHGCWLSGNKMAALCQGIPRQRARVRFLGYRVERYKLFHLYADPLFCRRNCRGALLSAGGHHQPRRIRRLIRPIYLASVAIGGAAADMGRLSGRVCFFASSWFTGGGATSIHLRFI